MVLRIEMLVKLNAQTPSGSPHLAVVQRANNSRQTMTP